jgi:hypothetical protein
MTARRLLAAGLARAALVLAMAVTAAPAASFAVEADKPLTVGRMKITIMPEYDSPAVLVVQEGKFADRNAFPRQVRFTLPKEVTKLTDVCSLSPGGHHFCQIFMLHYEKDFSYIDIKLPYSDFFIDYQYAPFTVKPASTRDFTFNLHADYAISLLEVHVQEPFGTRDFTLDPLPADTYAKDGFNYSKYGLTDIKAGETKAFHIKYFKDKVNPSVDEKFSAMLTPGIFKGMTGEILLGVAVAGLIVITLARRRARARAERGRVL